MEIETGTEIQRETGTETEIGTGAQEKTSERGIGALGVHHQAEITGTEHDNACL